MKLYINTADKDKIVIKLGDREYSADSKFKKSQYLLEFISEKLNEDSKSIKDISEIEVFTGPGSFTGLRVGVTIANTLGWSLDIPVNGKKHIVEPTYS